MAAHLTAFASYLIPFGGIVGSLVIMLIKKNESDYIAQEAKEALNFQISCCIYGIVALLLTIILIGFPLLVVLQFFFIIQVVIASIKTYEGRGHRYPLCIRMVK